MSAQPLRHSERGFERLYRSHVRNVYRYALVVTGNSADAEDVTQTTFMNAYRAFTQGQRPMKPENWLMTIAHNVLRQRARQSARRPNTVQLDDDLADPVVHADDTPSAADLQRALGHLAFNQRAALVMRELEGRSYAEIAEVLDLTVTASEMLVFRARRALREQLEGMLTCDQALEALNRDVDGQLPVGERAALRAHLRECQECAHVARRERARGTAWRALAAAPLPATLAPVGGGTAAVVAGLGVAMKTVAVTVAAATIAGGGYVVARHTVFVPEAKAPAHHHVQRTAHAKGVRHRSRHAPPPAQPATPSVLPAAPDTAPAATVVEAAAPDSQPQPQAQSSPSAEPAPTETASAPAAATTPAVVSTPAALPQSRTSKPKHVKSNHKPAENPGQGDEHRAAPQGPDRKTTPASTSFEEKHPPTRRKG